MKLKEKIKLIDKITAHHPSYGIKKGWSEYTGGMKDSGMWFFRIMLNATAKELQLFLDEIIRVESIPEVELTEQEKIDSKIIHTFNGGFITELGRKYFQKLTDEREISLLFNAQKNKRND